MSASVIKPGRLERALKALAGLSTVLVLLMLGFSGWRTWFVWKSDRKWARAVAELDATDPDWRWESLEAKREPVPDEDNSALFIDGIHKHGLLADRKRFVLIADFEPDITSPPNPAGDGSAEPLPMPAEFNETWVNNEVLNEVLNLPPEVRLGPSLSRALARTMRQHRPALDEALKLAERPRGRYPRDPGEPIWAASLKAQNSAEDVAILVGLESIRRVELGDAAGAMKSLQACLNVVRSLGDDPLAVRIRVRIGSIAVSYLERVLGRLAAPQEGLAVQQAALEAEAADPRIMRTLRGNRAVMTELLNAIISGEFERSERVDKDFKAMILRFDGPLSARALRPTLLRRSAEAMEVAALPSEEWTQHCDVGLGLMCHAGLADGIDRFPSRVFQAELRHLAELRTAYVALAAERFRIARGRWPAELRDLVDAGFLGQVPPDPYTGEQLRMKRVPFGLIIYSVGLDRIDDGGKRSEAWDVNNRFIRQTRTDRDGKPWVQHIVRGDIGFRLYDLPCRNMEAEPAPMPLALED
jgi:hypothetical protein